MIKSALMKKRLQQQKQTMEMIIELLKLWKTQKTSPKLPTMLMEIRTHDLREILPEIGPNHRYFRTLLDILKTTRNEKVIEEALYNLAVIVSEPSTVEPLMEQGIIEIVFDSMRSESTGIVYNSLWVLFGIASTNAETRDVCLGLGVLQKMDDVVKAHDNDDVYDIAGQLLYGMFSIKPLPDKKYVQFVLDHANEYLNTSNKMIKYALWCIFFSVDNDGKKLSSIGIVPRMNELLLSEDDTILNPLLTMFSMLFTTSETREGIAIDKFSSTLYNLDTCVRLKACRALADYENSDETIVTLLDNGLMETVIKLSKEDSVPVKEQGIYVIMKGFGLGSGSTQKRIAEAAAIEVLVDFIPQTYTRYACDIIDCLETLLMGDHGYYMKIHKSINTVQVLYPLLNKKEQQLTSKVANLMALIGE